MFLHVALSGSPFWVIDPIHVGALRPAQDQPDTHLLSS